MKCCETCDAPMPGAHSKRKFCDERCRKAQYAGDCQDCGAKTSGSNGRGPNASLRCARCWGAYMRARWSREKIIVALQESYERFGVTPLARAWFQRPGEGEPDRPTTNTVVNRFGSWRTALDAAGLPQNRTGRPRKRVAA